MTESAFTRKLLKALRSHAALKDAVIFKHADRFSAGVPDFSISIGPSTLWFEVKVKGNYLTKLQKYFMDRLKEGAVWIKADKDGKSACVWRAQEAGLYLFFDELVQQIVNWCVNG